MKTIVIDDPLPDSEVDPLAGTFMEPERFRHLVTGLEDVDVLGPAGEVIVKYRADVIPASAVKAAYPALRGAAKLSANRGLAGGMVDESSRLQPMRRKGYVSNTNEAMRKVESGIVGFFDRYPRTPYCRATAFNVESPELFESALPFFQAAGEAFKRELPDRYEAQMAVVRETHPSWVIHGTPFTTVTVNRNWRTALHKDAGDLRSGFGVMSVLRAGRYQGGVLVFPKYRVGVDMRTGGVCLADVHQWHGNTALVGRRWAFERIACVLYYREKMRACLSPAEELERVKNRKRGESLA